MPSKQPNILFIMTDQQRADTIATLGNPVITTPALDSLVAAGTSFTRAYTPAPICSPARVAMATGLPPHVHRFTDHDWWHGPDPDGAPSPAPHDPAFMQYANAAGYQTFFSGKVHHFGRPWLFEGVEEFAGNEPQISARTRELGSYGEFCRAQGYPPYASPGGLSDDFYYVPQTTLTPPEHANSHWLADQCLDFLERRDRNRPFLMQLHFHDPHPPNCNPMPWALMYKTFEIDAPYRPPDYKDYQSRANRYQNRYKGKETAQEDDFGFRTLKTAYYASISFVDYNIGRVLAALGQELENTVVIFTCDHGEMLGDYGCVGKRCMLEPAARIPFVMAWPGRVPAGRTCDTPVTLLDVFPTIAEVSGADVSPPSEEGCSLIGLANDRPCPERLVFSQFSSGWCGQYAVSDGKWKYCYSAPDHKEWLFELGDHVQDGPNRIDDPNAQQYKERLKAALMQRHDPAVDPFSNAVENGDWKVHTPPPESYLDDPNYGLLHQIKAVEQLEVDLAALGPYAREVAGKWRGNLHYDHGVCERRSPFE